MPCMEQSFCLEQLLSMQIRMHSISFQLVFFFASTVQMLYYVGAIQWILKKVSIMFIAVLDISGAESIVVAATVSNYAT
jgi:nucleoside permease NupC